MSDVKHDLQAFQYFQDTGKPQIVDTPWGQVDLNDKAGKKHRRAKETTDDTKRLDISNAVLNVRVWAKQTAPTSVQQISDRIDLFFYRCIQTGEIPTLEKLYRAIGIFKSTADDWLKGKNCTPIVTALITRAVEDIASIDSELAQSGKINPVVYIFRSKNFYGMSDTKVNIDTIVDNRSNYDDLKRLYSELPSTDNNIIDT